jgi:protein-L-isoaspartate(D-aspartate) O-methyltransferase
MMKILPPFAFMAVACEAMAQEDAQCVRERAAMVETIRTYARSEAGVLGPQGISEISYHSLDGAKFKRPSQR